MKSITQNLRSVVGFTCAATENRMYDNIRPMTSLNKIQAKNYNNCLQPYGMPNLGQFQLQLKT